MADIVCTLKASDFYNSFSTLNLVVAEKFLISIATCQKNNYIKFSFCRHRHVAGVGGHCTLYPKTHSEYI